MKRYTLKFTILDREVTVDPLKAQLEKILLRLHPRIIFKMGQLIKTEQGIILALFTADGKMELLETSLRDTKWKLPVEFESMGWGWLIDPIHGTPGSGEGFIVETDPLAQVVPVVEPIEFRFNQWKLLGRYLYLIVFTLVMILLLIANAIHTHSPLLQWIYVLGFTVWLFSLNDVPINPRAYATRIVCTLDNLEIYYDWRRKSVQLDWEHIWGMDYADPLSRIYSDDGVSRFVLSERYGFKEKKMVLKTIVTRASLNYIEGNIRAVVYKRFDAKF